MNGLRVRFNLKLLILLISIAACVLAINQVLQRIKQDHENKIKTELVNKIREDLRIGRKVKVEIIENRDDVCIVLTEFKGGFRLIAAYFHHEDGEWAIATQTSPSVDLGEVADSFIADSYREFSSRPTAVQIKNFKILYGP